MKILTADEQAIIKGKLEGKEQRQIGQELYPQLTKGGQSVKVSRVLKRAAVQTELQKALNKYGLKLDSVIKPIADALVANKYSSDKQGWFDTGLPDHGTRLKAAGMLADWLKPKDPPIAGPSMSTDDIKQLLKSKDEVELQRLVFKETPKE